MGGVKPPYFALQSAFATSKIGGGKKFMIERFGVHNSCQHASFHASIDLDHGPFR